MPDLLSGWGRTAPTAATVVRPRDVEHVSELLAAPTHRGVAARGLGRSYGDSAQNAGGLVLDLTGLNQILDLDLTTGVLRAQAGVRLDSLLRRIVAAGWFLPVTPGTSAVTVGGAIAADVHGKNHHRDGSLGRYVLSITVAIPDADVVTVTAKSDPELFFATLGGMGLTGIIVESTIQLMPIANSMMSVNTTRAANLDQLLEELMKAEANNRYGVAWLDCLASGRSMGRGIVTSGDHATSDETSGRRTAQPRSHSGESATPGTRSFTPPCGFVTRGTIAALNELWFRKSPTHKAGEILPFEKFFYPLDRVRGWNRLYGPSGFLQHQCVVPEESTLRFILAELAKARVPVALAVLKRFGPGTPGPLSFPRPGWTLALDIATRAPELAPILDKIDDLVADSGGTIYLAKDSRVRPELIPVMYPRLSEWNAIRDRVDPNRRLVSDQSRRLSL